MAQKCPRCGLFNPPEAIRCDCGYDFKTQTVESSYLAAHVLRKHGGADNILRVARSNVKDGVILLVVGIATSVIAYLASGSVYVLVGAILWGAMYVYRGLRQHRLGQNLLQRPAGRSASHRK